MSTGISSWANPDAIGAIYPFVGSEMLLTVAGVAFWIWWHIKQIRDENRELEEAAAAHRREGLDKVMEQHRGWQQPEVVIEQTLSSPTPQGVPQGATSGG